MADHLDKMVKTLSVASDNRTYRGTVTPDNAAVAWAEHRPVIDQAVAILAAGGTPAELDAAAAQVAKIAAAWRGSGVTADDGTPMTNHLDGLVQSLSESSEITQSNYDQRAEFEKVFREITKREPSGDLAKDADILSRYGENALTDMSYAAEVQAFEKTFRDTTGREPSVDLVKDADILSRYGENALTDGDFVMGLTSEPSDLVETWGGKEAVYITSDKQPTDDESEAAFRIVTKEDGTPLVESIDRYDPTNSWDLRSRYDEEGKRYTSTGLHPGRVLGASDQNQAAAEIVDQNMVGRHIDQWGTIELPDQNRATTRHAGGPRGRGTTTEVEIRGVPGEYIVDWDAKGNPILAPGWQEAVVPLSLNRSRIEGLNPDNTYQTGDPTLWARAKPWVSVVPGASTMIKLSDIKHPGSADGSQITGREWREFGAEALVDSVYLVGWPYGAVNLARGVGTAAAKGGLKAAGKQTLHMARPDRLAKTMLWEPSLPNVGRIVTRQGVNTVKNLRNPLTSIGTKGKGTLKGLASETGEELLVEYPFEVAAPHIFGVADPAKPLFTGDWSDLLSIRPGSGLIPSRDDALWMGGSVGVFGVLEGVGGRRFSPGGDVEIPTFEGPQSAGRRDFGDGGQHLPGGTRWQASGEMRRHHHLPHEPSAGFHEGGAFDAWPSGWESLMPPTPGGYQRSGSGLLLPTPTPTAMAPPVPSLTPGETPSPAPTPAPTPTPTDTPIPTPTPTPSDPPTRAGAIPRSRFPDRIVTVVPGPAPSSTISTAISPTPTDPPSFPTPPTWKSIALPTPVPPPGPPVRPLRPVQSPRRRRRLTLPLQPSH